MRSIPALCCNLLQFSALYRPPQKKISKRSQEGKKKCVISTQCCAFESGRG